jgi:hypothetical protein
MDADPRAAKLLGDLLALTLSENEGQATAALHAIRRRAERDGVTGGALKQVVEALAAHEPPPPPPPPPAANASAELRILHDTIEIQRRELSAARQGKQRAEAALAREQLARATLLDEAGRQYRSRRNGWMAGFLLGLGIGAAGIAATVALRGGRSFAAGALPRGARAELVDFLHSCAMTSSNSLAGVPVRVHVVVDVDGSGRIIRASLAPEEAETLNDPEQMVFAGMVVRTLTGGACGKLPLPPAFQGHPGRLDLILPR